MREEVWVPGRPKWVFGNEENKRNKKGNWGCEEESKKKKRWRSPPALVADWGKKKKKGAPEKIKMKMGGKNKK